jgi:hypothetical protein
MFYFCAECPERLPRHEFSIGCWNIAHSQVMTFHSCGTARAQPVQSSTLGFRRRRIQSRYHERRVRGPFHTLVNRMSVLFVGQFGEKHQPVKFNGATNILSMPLLPGQAKETSMQISLWVIWHPSVEEDHATQGGREKKRFQCGTREHSRHAHTTMVFVAQNKHVLRRCSPPNFPIRHGWTLSFLP